MRALSHLLGTLLLAGAVGGNNLPSPAALDVVEQLHKAFNDHDAAAMAQLVAKDFELYYVGTDGDTAQAASSRAELEDQMASYFRSFPEVRSRIEERLPGGTYVAIRERIEGGAASLAVYEVRDGFIRRTWYYPAE